jgi:hypothetical protein
MEALGDAKVLWRTDVSAGSFGNMDLGLLLEAGGSEWVELFADDSDVAVIYWLTAAKELAARQDTCRSAWNRFADAAEHECMRRGLPILTTVH